MPEAIWGYCQTCKTKHEVKGEKIETVKGLRVMTGKCASCKGKVKLVVPNAFKL